MMRNDELRASVSRMVGCVALGMSLCVVGTAAIAVAQPPTLEAPEVSDGERFTVTEFVPRYSFEHPQLPDPAVILDLTVKLGTLPDGYAKPRAGIPTAMVRLGDVPSMSQQTFYRSGLQEIMESIYRYFRDEVGVIGVYVGPDQDQLTSERLDDGVVYYDERSNGDTSLNIMITVGRMSEMRTIASGTRIPSDDRINHPKHDRILRHSPVMPGGEDGTDDLLNKQDVDEYVFRLNRHPGRRVDVAISAARDPGGMALDYLVAENRPWFVYGQVSNTGTKQTDRIRERIGFVHNQITGRDDVLSLDYFTSAFDQTNAIMASYEAPLFGTKKWRWKGFGTWNEFTASDVGFANEGFTGKSWTAGGELIFNFFQHEELFIDAIGGARFEHVLVKNKLVDITGEDSFLIPYVGARLERATEIATTLAQVTVEANLPNIADTDFEKANRLGRLEPDTDFSILRWDASHTFFVEPLVDRESWLDRASWESSTLAHEVSLRVRGQYSFNNRLIPQEEQTIGGLYSVRGYPESSVAGDTVIVASAEYRYHIPRAFEPNADPSNTPLFGEPFRFAPQSVYGRPDWDFIVRGFFDVGHSEIADPFLFEEDVTIAGAGIGVELVLKQNLNIRADWGFALKELQESQGTRVDAGANRLHVVATVLF